MKYVFVVGGVMSGVGKGVASASIGRILSSCGFQVTAVKIDPYVNVDAGTMNPTEHGEVFVLEDGTECDQDVGNYERFLLRSLSKRNYMTTGSVYQHVIAKERSFEYGGRCVEVVPHIPLEVLRRIDEAARADKANIIIVEIGGTVGEYQNVLFLEAVRMLKLKEPRNVLLTLVSFLPSQGGGGELKTKPTQYAVRTINSAGLQPDIIIGRAKAPLDKKRKAKIAFNCNIREEDVISAPDVESIYEIPINFEKDKLSRVILGKLNLKPRQSKLIAWNKLVKTIKSAKKPVKIGIVGKYFGTGDFALADSYISVIEAIKHAAFFWKRKPIIDWLNAEEFEKNRAKLASLSRYDGIIVPGGFGGRGVEGKISAISYARTHKIPFLGLCYGMQLAAVEFARHSARLLKAHTTEVMPQTPHPVIAVLPEQRKKLREKKYGGTMRLGAYPAALKKGSIASRAYNGALSISERHRHRYEVNPAYRAKLERAGLVCSGNSPDGRLVEIIELPRAAHPFFVGTQFHPEFTSRPLTSHPLFKAFIKAAISSK